MCGSLEKMAEHFKMAEEEVGRLLTGAREALFREWLSRPKPHRDNKILTAWNGERSGPRKVMRVYLEINAVNLVLHICRPFSVCHITD